ncbi:hypothetical protein HJA76_09790 [Rhizobium bangladeshense]|uniref:hypothetical protein n=1 Tax=Rhizobium bangladeshense TaxID=1138189 RepID=UPI001C82C085|nr:hypothetical protein [Rhizobium bangladeshense]MBX4919999.1 hypothetical protein [Rhizobium bangladeshense]
MTQYRVTSFHIVEADNLVEAAQKAFILNEEMTPVEYQIHEEEGFEEEVGPSAYRYELTAEDRDKARELQSAGKLFRTTDLQD